MARRNVIIISYDTDPVIHIEGERLYSFTMEYKQDWKTVKKFTTKMMPWGHGIGACCRRLKQRPDSVDVRIDVMTKCHEMFKREYEYTQRTYWQIEFAAKGYELKWDDQPSTNFSSRDYGQAEEVWVNEYTRSDGTVVQGHSRRNPNYRY